MNKKEIIEEINERIDRVRISINTQISYLNGIDMVRNELKDLLEDIK